MSHRATSFLARDLFDFAAVSALEPNALHDVSGLLRMHRAALLERLRGHREALREDFAALHAWEFRPSFEDCEMALRAALSRASLPPVVEQERRPYEVAPELSLPAQRLHDAGHKPWRVRVGEHPPIAIEPGEQVGDGRRCAAHRDAYFFLPSFFASPFCVGSSAGFT